MLLTHQHRVRSLKARAVVKLEFPTGKNLCTIYEALEPETRKGTTIRSEARLKESGRFLILEVEAEDSVALRAAVNAYLRWIDSTVKVLNVLKKED